MENAKIHAVVKIAAERMHCAEYQTIELFVSAQMDTKENQQWHVVHLNVKQIMIVTLIKSAWMDLAKILVWNTMFVELMLNVEWKTVWLPAHVYLDLSETLKWSVKNHQSLPAKRTLVESIAIA